MVGDRRLDVIPDVIVGDLRLDVIPDVRSPNAGLDVAKFSALWWKVLGRTSQVRRH